MRDAGDVVERTKGEMRARAQVRSQDEHERDCENACERVPAYEEGEAVGRRVQGP